MRMFFREPEAARGAFLGVELDENRLLVPDHPRVVAGLEHDDLGRDVFEPAAVVVFALDVSAGEKADVRVHAKLGAGDRLHVCRPAEPGRIDRALDASVSRPDGVDLGAPDVSVVGSLDGLEQRVHGRQA